MIEHVLLGEAGERGVLLRVLVPRLRLGHPGGVRNVVVG